MVQKAGVNAICALGGCQQLLLCVFPLQNKIQRVKAKLVETAKAAELYMGTGDVSPTGGLHRRGSHTHNCCRTRLLLPLPILQVRAISLLLALAKGNAGACKSYIAKFCRILSLVFNPKPALLLLPASPNPAGACKAFIAKYCRKVHAGQGRLAACLTNQVRVFAALSCGAVFAAIWEACCRMHEARASC